MTNCPKKRYTTQTVHPLHPRVIHSMVPRAREWANPSGVSIVFSLGRREKKRMEFKRKEGRKGTLPVKENRFVRSGEDRMADMGSWLMGERWS